MIGGPNFLTMGGDREHPNSGARWKVLKQRFLIRITYSSKKYKDVVWKALRTKDEKKTLPPLQKKIISKFKIKGRGLRLFTFLIIQSGSKFDFSKQNIYIFVKYSFKYSKIKGSFKLSKHSLSSDSCGELLEICGSGSIFSYRARNP